MGSLSSLPEWSRKALFFFQDLFFPPTCLHCQQIGQHSTPIPGLCPQCLDSLIPLPQQFEEAHILSRLHPCYLDELWIAYQFNPVVRDLIHAIKYQKMPRLGERFGKYARKELEPHLLKVSQYRVLPIPLHKIREKEREYNQSLCIARGIFAASNGQLRNDILFRQRNTKSQTQLNRLEREENVQGAFALNSQLLAEMSCDAILVDDVVTTGATMNECARLLKAAGVEKVCGAAIATSLVEEEKNN